MCQLSSLPVRRVLVAACLLVALAVTLAGCASQPASPPAQPAAPAPAKATAVPPASKAVEPAAPAFPTKPVTIIVWSGPGVADTKARLIASIMEKDLGQPVLVENKEGGGGVVAVNYLLAQPADGYKFLIVTPGLPMMFSEPGVTFKAGDFEPLVMQDLQPYILIVPAKSPFKTVEDFLSHAKANPGKLRVGGPFATGAHRLHWDSFAEAAKISATWVPFEGSGPADLAVAGGQIDAGTTNSSANVKRLAETDKVRPLVVTTDKRLTQLPDVPTAKEKGVAFTYFNWSATVARKGVPKPIVDKLIAAQIKAAQSKEWKDYMESQGTIDGSPTSPAEIRQLMDRADADTVQLRKRLGP